MCSWLKWVYILYIVNHFQHAILAYVYRHNKLTETKNNHTCILHTYNHKNWRATNMAVYMFSQCFFSFMCASRAHSLSDYSEADSIPIEVFPAVRPPDPRPQVLFHYVWNVWWNGGHYLMGPWYRLPVSTWNIACCPVTLASFPSLLRTRQAGMAELGMRLLSLCHGASQRVVELSVTEWSLWQNLAGFGRY